MPTYDYECRACGHTWEAFESMSAKPTKECPKCRKKKASRLIGAGAGLLFKGSGFYITDYRSSDYKSKQSAEKPADPKPADSKAAPPKSCAKPDNCACKPPSKKKS